MGSYYAPGPLPRPPTVWPVVYNVEPSRTGRTGRDYLESIGPSLESLNLGGPSRHTSHYPRTSLDKPLPDLPSSHMPARPTANVPMVWSHPYPVYQQQPPPLRTPPRVPPRPTTEYTPPRLLFPPSQPVHRPHSDPIVSFPKTTPTKTPKTRPKDRPKSTGHTIIDKSLSSSESSAEYSDDSIPRNITPRSKHRRKRAASEQPSRIGLLTPTKPTHTRARLQSVSPAPPGNAPGAVRCSGFTRTGAPCKRLVKVSAPYLTAIDTNVPTPGGRDDVEDVMDQAGLGRYCKDHAGMICQSTGFYSKEKRGLWIDFDELGQQTQTLLRMAMESKLTAKESPGFIYAYELRDLQTPSTCYYKVGRTDNVPRRIGQWTNKCQSHSPTLRDIFPTSTGGNPQREASLMPGAMQAGTIATGDPSLAVKRWERLIHLELAEISSRDREYQFKKLREKCGDCGTCHREIFALAREEGSDAEGCYAVVREVIERWERFVKHVCGA